MPAHVLRREPVIFVRVRIGKSAERDGAGGDPSTTGRNRLLRPRSTKTVRTRAEEVWTYLADNTNATVVCSEETSVGWCGNR